MNKKILFRTLAAVIALAAPFIASAKDVNVRIGSYNIRMQQLDKNTPDSWELRRPRCMQSIRDNNFDVFGLQELTDFVQDQLREDLGDKYEFIFFGPYNQDGTGTKAQGIAYDKKRFKLLEYHYFWLSDTPDQVSDNDHYNHKGKTGSYKRGGACALLKDRKSGKKIFFMNHHGILNLAENEKYAHVLIDMEKKYNPKGCPSFLVGDFNARVDHPSHLQWRAHWSDSADTAGERQCTFSSFNPNPASWDKGRHIDFIYYRNVGAPFDYKVNQTLYDGRCASDHFPIWADFKLK